jgi:pimeloyl-ACP methyl ester carboxylesterase
VDARQWWQGLSARRRLLLAVVAGLVIAVVAVLVPRLLATPATADRSKLGTVLLIPGYGGSQGSLQELAGHLRETGRDAVVVSLPGDGTGDLNEQVSVLDRAVSDAYDRGAPSVDLVGYSAGGVVARLWVSRNSSAARRVVTLGSPLHGTQLATGGNTLLPDACPTACRQLATGSSLLQSVVGEPVPLPWMSIWTELDQTVIPPDSARLDGAVNVPLQSVCPASRVSHSQLPSDPVVTRIVLRALGLAPLASPTAADC